jgi:vitamin B12 transporter
MSARLTLIASVLLSVALLATAPLVAVDPVFEDEITVTATGEERPAAELPAAVTVITREDIEDSLTETAADLLRQVPGLTVARSGPEGSQTSVFTRGTESDHTLVLFDGVRLNSPYFGGYDWSLIATTGLERIEVARGPYSALWGADAIGGVVNLIPDPGLTKGFKGKVFGEGGDDGWERYEGAFSYGYGKFGMMASGIQREAEDRLPNSDFKLEQALVDAGWSWNNGSRVAFLYQDLDSETGIPLIDPLTPSPNRRQRAEQRLTAFPVRLQIAKSWGIELLTATVERQLSLRDPDDPWGLTSTDTTADSTEYRLASHHSFGEHSLTWGGEWREDEVSNANDFGINLAAETAEMSSAFIQDVWTASDEVRVIVGARWDDTEDWGSEVSPRINIGWKTSPTVELRLGYGEAFRQPSIGELYFPLSGNPDLTPEASRSAEIGLVYRPTNFSTRWQLEDMIDFDYATFSNRNIAKAKIRGAELIVDNKISSFLRSSTQITYLDTEGADGHSLLRRPEWSASYTVSGQFTRRSRGSMTTLWVGERDDIDPLTFDRAKNGDYYVVHLALAYALWQGGELTFRVFNLSDEGYQEVLGYRSPKRRFVAGIRIAL